MKKKTVTWRFLVNQVKYKESLGNLINLMERRKGFGTLLRRSYHLLVSITFFGPLVWGRGGKVQKHSVNYTCQL